MNAEELHFRGQDHAHDSGVAADHRPEVVGSRRRHRCHDVAAVPQESIGAAPPPLLLRLLLLRLLLLDALG